MRAQKKILIEKYETQAKMLLDVITHNDTTEENKETAAACRRFVMGFIYDLKNTYSLNG